MIRIERVPEMDGSVSLWSVDTSTTDPHERRLLGHEQAVRPRASKLNAHQVICWSHGRTLGNVEIFNEDVLSTLPGRRGVDVVIDCDMVGAGKMRNGAPRWWCRTHQAHWGTKADIAAAHASGTLLCSNHEQLMSFVVDPPSLRLDQHAEVGVWCSMPPALTSAGATMMRRPKIHAHVRNEVAGKKVLDGDVEALTVRYGAHGDLYAGTDLTTVHITPPAAFEFVTALEEDRPLGFIACRDCGAPHLDLGEFGRVAHTKHLCSNCGRDGIRSRQPMASTPLKPLHDQYLTEPAFVDVDRVLDIDAHPGAAFAIWASTPAVLWTSRRPQERGIHVHLSLDGKRVYDDTYGSDIYRGEQLQRADLLATMIANSIV